MPESVKRIGERVRLYALFYLYAMLASSWNAGIATALASLGLAAGAAIDPEHVQALNWHQIFTAFKYGAVINALFYLRSHPLPERLPLNGAATNAPFPSP
jgi:hypothetical protein